MWLLLVIACSPWSAADLDGDGVAAPADCDDGDPLVRPGARDPVGGRPDANCDGVDGVDADGDGIPSVGSGGEDCDDADPSVHPGAPERCNGDDDDCDGAVDELEAGESFGRDGFWFRDADGDGVGAGVGSCDPPDPVGWVARSGDCDDTDARRYPGAPEPCALDLNCDEVVFACEPVQGELGGGHVLTGPLAGSGAGWSVAAVGDFDGDGWDDLAIGAPDLGRAWIVGGPIAQSGTIEDQARTTLLGTGTDRAGVSLAALGDVDADGRYDVLIGAELDDVGGSDSGAAWLLFGGLSAGGTLSLHALHLVGEQTGDLAGRAVAGPGDVDGDGIPDLLIGAPGRGPGGAAYVVSGTVSQNRSLGDSELILEGSPGAGAGWALDGGDVDGDGISDMVIGGPMAGAGQAWVVLGQPGNPSNTVSLDVAGVALSGPSDGDLLGWQVVVADVDGDGGADLWLGAPGADGARGTAWWLTGSDALLGGPVADRASGSVSGLVEGERVGEGLAGVADRNGDGVAEILIAGTGGQSVTVDDGAVWLVSGGPGAVDIGAATAWAVGADVSDALGAGLGAGDLNHDGIDDLILGAPGAGQPGYGVGQTTILYGD